MIRRLCWVPSSRVEAKPPRTFEATMQPSSDRGQVESQLLACVKRLERNYYDWRAVHLHLSQLKAQNRRRLPAAGGGERVRRPAAQVQQRAVPARQWRHRVPVAWWQPRRCRPGGPAPALPVQRRPARQRRRAAPTTTISDLLAGPVEAAGQRQALHLVRAGARVRSPVPASRGAGRVAAGGHGRSGQQRRATARSRPASRGSRPASRRSTCPA